MKSRRPTLALLAALLVMGQPLLAERADPTAPATHSNNPTAPGAAARSGWELHSTLVSAERRGAVINGQSVREGDQVAGARVARILAGEVFLDTPERRIHLRLLPNPLRTHAQE
jgi:MSHA biogenesis protein MshK